MTTDSIIVHLDHTNTPLIEHMANTLRLVNVSFFLYYINYQDGAEIKCTNRPDWTSYFVEKELYKKSVFTQAPQTLNAGFQWLEDVEDAEINQIRKEKFDITNVLAWVNPMSNGAEIFFFGSSANHSPMHFYFNHLDTLKQSILYFKNQLSQELSALQAHKLLLPQRLDERDQPTQNMLDNAQLQLFKQHIKIKKFYLDSTYADATISARELDILQLLATGGSYQSIAEKLHISSRTVESHVTNLKHKLDLEQRHQLIAFYQQHFIT